MKVRRSRGRRDWLLTSAKKGIATGAIPLVVLVIVVCSVIAHQQVERLSKSQETATTESHQVRFKPSTAASEAERPKVTLYSRGRKDRAGAAILDALLCHAFAFQENAIYGGICIEKNLKGTSEMPLPYIEDQQKLIAAFGLHDELPFACPTDRSGLILRREDYFSQDTSVFTDFWLSLIRSRRRRSTGPVTLHAGTVQVAVHMRRGDVTPCTEPERYLPNSYYLSVMDEYVLPQLSSSGRPINVTIYSERASFEGWDPFEQRGYHLELGSHVGPVWEAFVAADVLVLSRSSFSLVPALFNENVVIYTPFWHQPLENWTVVPKIGVDVELKRLREACS